MDVQSIAETLRRAESVLLVAHVNPDADALGSTLATGIALEAIGQQVRVTFPDDPFLVPANLRFLPRQDLLIDPSEAAADVVMSMDASSPDRLGRLWPLAQGASTSIAIDHHASFTPFADVNLCDAGQPATGMLALALIDELGVDVTAAMATCLYAALSSDTGSFRYPATTPETMRTAARLMDHGIDHAGIAKALFDTKSRGLIGLQAEVMQTLEMRDHEGLMLAVARVPADLRVRWEVPFVDAECLIDTVRTLEGVDIAIVLKQDDLGQWRVSTRSLGHADVGAACTRAGGGGHRMAAGFTGTRDADETLGLLLGALAA